MQKIKIYDDKGVHQQCLDCLHKALVDWAPEKLTAQELLHTNWENETALLVMPGGRDIPYHRALSGQGNARILNFIEQGGSYLGICAGAYYGCQTVEFDRGGELEVLAERELAFFPGIARGPAYGTGTFCYRSEKGARATLVSMGDEQDPFRSYFNGGCYFVDAASHPHVKIVARYLEIVGHPAAVIEIPVGRGKVILSGIHCEVSATSSMLLEPIAQALLPFEGQRKAFFEMLIERLLKGRKGHKGRKGRK